MEAIILTNPNPKTRRRVVVIMSIHKFQTIVKVALHKGFADFDFVKLKLIIQSLCSMKNPLLCILFSPKN